MALIVCPDCTRQVSPKARFCVHCGRPCPAGKGTLRKVMTALLFVGIAASGWAGTSYWNNNKEFRIKTMSTLDSLSSDLKKLSEKFGSSGGAPSKADKLPLDEKERQRKESD